MRILYRTVSVSGALEVELLIVLGAPGQDGIVPINGNTSCRPRKGSNGDTVRKDVRGGKVVAGIRDLLAVGTRLGKGSQILEGGRVKDTHHTILTTNVDRLNQSQNAGEREGDRPEE